MQCPRCGYSAVVSVQWSPLGETEAWTTKTIPPGSLADAEKFARGWSDTLRGFRYRVLDGDGKVLSEWLAGNRVGPAVKISESSPAAETGGGGPIREAEGTS